MTRSDILAVKEWLSNFEGEWAICGGWAIDLFLGKQMRLHKDVDILIWRDEQLKAQSYFLEHGWVLEIASKGELTPWEVNKYLELPLHTVWCKHETFKPDFVELLFNERNETQFLFRRDQSVRFPLNQIILQTHDGIPYLAPQIVLLYKAHVHQDKHNQQDFDVAFESMDKRQKTWLVNSIKMLYGEQHDWL